MNETELRSAIDVVMTRSEQPEPMDGTRVLGAARRARARRRTVLAGSATALAVGAVAVAAVMVPGLPGAGSVQPATPLTITASGSDAEVDAKKELGPAMARAKDLGEQGRDLLLELADSVPDGYEASTDLRQNTPGLDPLRNPIGHLSGEVWDIVAVQPVAKDGGLGQVLVEVHSPANRLPDDPCKLARSFRAIGGDCEVVTVGGKEVGVVTDPTEGGTEFDQWAAYRHADGMVLYVAQAKLLEESGEPALSTLPFTARQLAALATDDRFHIE